MDGIPPLFRFFVLIAFLLFLLFRILFLYDYFLTVITQGNHATAPAGDQVFGGDENDKLRDAIMTRQVVPGKVNRSKKYKSLDPDEIFTRVLRECKGVLKEKRDRRKGEGTEEEGGRHERTKMRIRKQPREKEREWQSKVRRNSRRKE